MVAGGDNCTAVKPPDHTVYTVVLPTHQVVRQAPTQTDTPIPSHRDRETKRDTHAFIQTPIHQ